MNVTTRAYDAIRDRLSMKTRRRIAERRVRLRKPTARFRALPDFLIIGAQRSGTSSLYRYLGGHPELISSLRKETEYFTRRFVEGPDWYRAHFPLALRLRIQNVTKANPTQSFEATPDYLFHPLAPTRIRQALPNAKFIVLLRDPIERCVSHYKHMRMLGFENLDLDSALDAEEARVAPDLEELARNPFHPCLDAMRFSYVGRGLYAEQLQRWFAEFERDRFLIIDAADLFMEYRKTLLRICRFVGVSDWAPSEFRNYSQRSSPTRGEPVETSEETRQRLMKVFRRESERVNELVGTTLSWTTTRAKAEREPPRCS